MEPLRPENAAAILYELLKWFRMIYSYNCRDPMFLKHVFNLIFPKIYLFFWKKARL